MALYSHDKALWHATTCVKPPRPLQSFTTPCRGSSPVERGPEKAGVGSSTLPPGTTLKPFVISKSRTPKRTMSQICSQLALHRGVGRFAAGDAQVKSKKCTHKGESNGEGKRNHPPFKIAGKFVPVQQLPRKIDAVEYEQNEDGIFAGAPSFAVGRAGPLFTWSPCESQVEPPKPHSEKKTYLDSAHLKQRPNE